MTRPVVWSPSRLEKLLGCELAYQLYYGEGESARHDDRAGLTAQASLLVHGALEDMGLVWMEHGPFGSEVTAERLDAEIRRRLATSDRHHSPEVVAEALALGARAARTPWVLDFTDLWGVEHDLAFEIPCPDCAGSECDVCAGTGAIRACARADRLDLPAECGPVVIDYKASDNVKPHEFHRHNPQALILLVGARIAWPDLPPPMVVFVHFGQSEPVRVPWDDELEARGVNLLLHAARRLAHLRRAGGTWPATDVLAECSWCPFGASCDQHRRLLDGVGVEPAGSDVPADAVAVLAARQRAAVVAKLAEKRKGELSQVLHPLLPLTAAGYVAAERSTPHTSYTDLQRTAEAIALVTGEDPSDVAWEIGRPDKSRTEDAVTRRATGMDADQREVFLRRVQATARTTVSRHPFVTREPKAKRALGE